MKTASWVVLTAVGVLTFLVGVGLALDAKRLRQGGQ
jgi:hypothetical protein